MGRSDYGFGAKRLGLRVEKTRGKTSCWRNDLLPEPDSCRVLPMLLVAGYQFKETKNGKLSTVTISLLKHCFMFR